MKCQLFLPAAAHVLFLFLNWFDRQLRVNFLFAIFYSYLVQHLKDLVEMRKVGPQSEAMFSSTIQHQPMMTLTQIILDLVVTKKTKMISMAFQEFWHQHYLKEIQKAIKIVVEVQIVAMDASLVVPLLPGVLLKKETGLVKSILTFYQHCQSNNL